MHRLLRRAVEPHQLRLSFLGTRQHLPPAPPEPSGDGDEGSQSLEELARAAGVQVDVGAPLYLVLDLQVSRRVGRPTRATTRVVLAFGVERESLWIVAQTAGEP